MRAVLMRACGPAHLYASAPWQLCPDDDRSEAAGPPSRVGVDDVDDAKR